MRKAAIVLIVTFLASVAFAQIREFTGSAETRKGLAVSGIAEKINAVVVQAEAAYRRGTPYASAVHVKGDIQDAIDKVVGTRVNMFATVNDIQYKSGKTVAVIKMDVRSKLVWTKYEQDSYDSAERAYDSHRKEPVPKYSSSSAVNSWNKEDDRLKARVADIKRKNDKAATDRIPDAEVNVEFDSLPAFVKVGNKVNLSGWIRSVSVKHVNPNLQDITYPDVTFFVVYEDMRVFGAAATQPDEPATQSAATQPGVIRFGDNVSAASATTQPATQASGALRME